MTQLRRGIGGCFGGRLQDGHPADVCRFIAGVRKAGSSKGGQGADAAQSAALTRLSRAVPRALLAADGKPPAGSKLFVGYQETDHTLCAYLSMHVMAAVLVGKCLAASQESASDTVCRGAAAAVGGPCPGAPVRCAGEGPGSLCSVCRPGQAALRC